MSEESFIISSSMKVRENGKRRKGDSEEFFRSHPMMSTFKGIWKASPDHGEEKQWSLPARK
jgi:hypothetical protein